VLEKVCDGLMMCMTEAAVEAIDGDCSGSDGRAGRRGRDTVKLVETTSGL
jgi:hypothetical protein